MYAFSIILTYFSYYMVTIVDPDDSKTIC